MGNEKNTRQKKNKNNKNQQLTYVRSGRQAQQQQQKTINLYMAQKQKNSHRTKTNFLIKNKQAWPWRGP